MLCFIDFYWVFNGWPLSFQRVLTGFFFDRFHFYWCIAYRGFFPFTFYDTRFFVLVSIEWERKRKWRTVESGGISFASHLHLICIRRRRPRRRDVTGIDRRPAVPFPFPYRFFFVVGLSLFCFFLPSFTEFFFFFEKESPKGFAAGSSVSHRFRFPFVFSFFFFSFLFFRFSSSFSFTVSPHASPFSSVPSGFH